MEEIDALVSDREENIDGRILARSKSQRKFNRRVQRPHRYRRPQSEHQRRECCRDWCRFVYNITLVFAHQPPDNTTLYHLGVQVTEQPKSKFIHSCSDKSPVIVKQPVQPSVGYKVPSIPRSPETQLFFDHFIILFAKFFSSK